METHAYPFHGMACFVHQVMVTQSSPSCMYFLRHDCYNFLFSSPFFLACIHLKTSIRRNLSYKNLKGTLPPSISKMRHLRELYDLTNISFIGSFFSFRCYCNFSYSGFLLITIFLWSRNMSNNKFSSVVPAFPASSILTSVYRTLHLLELINWS